MAKGTAYEGSAASNNIKSETCYYQNDAASEHSACTQAGGTWSTTP